MTELLDTETASKIARTFKGLGDPTRLRLLSILFKGETCVSDLAEQTGISQSAVSHQLRTLRSLGFVSNRRDGQNIYYMIDDEHIQGLFDLALAHSLHH
ncbi:MAG: metalloregulator ArsR/SmtB family transcription factor [Anaerolineaceae bacterium]|jgi:DNA-binding transcriptional ArsR family regulator